MAKYADGLAILAEVTTEDGSGATAGGCYCPECSLGALRDIAAHERVRHIVSQRVADHEDPLDRMRLALRALHTATA